MNSSTFRQAFSQYLGLLGALVLLVAIFAWLSPGFFSSTSLLSIAGAIPDLTVVTVGMTLVLILGGIDLSVGSLLALSSSIFAVLIVRYQVPLPLAGLAAICVSGALGLCNGWISTQFRIPAFIVTLGMLEIARGLAYLVTDSQTIYVGSKLEWIAAPLAGLQLSPALITALLCVIGGQFLLERTVQGRMTIAIGTNAETVRMSGVPVMPYALTTYAISGVLCGLGAIFQASRLESADPNAGVGLELSAIAACVIGGTSLRGGQGSVISAFFGVLIVQVLQSGLAHVGVSEPLKARDHWRGNCPGSFD